MSWVSEDCPFIEPLPNEKCSNCITVGRGIRKTNLKPLKEYGSPYVKFCTTGPSTPIHFSL